tara:strand:- start:96 stop:314 length:219 start_codon:yes stop_codon:yes gene_type:complete
MDKQSQLNKNLLENNLDVYKKLEEAENERKKVVEKAFKLKKNGLISGDIYDFLNYEYSCKTLEELIENKEEK